MCLATSYAAFGIQLRRQVAEPTWRRHSRRRKTHEPATLTHGVARFCLCASSAVTTTGAGLFQMWKRNSAQNCASDRGYCPKQNPTCRIFC